MNEVEDYLKKLLEKAVDCLQKECKLASIKFSDFQKINFYIIDQAVNKNKSLFIQSFDKEHHSLSQFPAMLAISIALFFKNFCNNGTTYEIGDIVQSDQGERFKITEFDGHKYTLVSDQKRYERGSKLTRITKRYLDIKKILEYVITDADISDRKVKVKFNEYKEFFNLLFGVKDVPSKFHHKAAIIVEKKEFDEEIKNQKYVDIDIRKAVPIRWISKNDTESWNHIPIEPMIYFVPDFETLQGLVLEKGVKIETLIIIGKNKYDEDIISRIRQNIAEEKFSSCIILGDSQFSDENHRFLKWRWTFPEFSLLEGFKDSFEIEPILVKDESFENAIDQYKSFLDQLREDFSVNLNNIKSLLRYCYPLTLSMPNDSRNIIQVEYVKDFLLKASKESIEENLGSQDIDSSEYVSESETLIRNIFGSFNNEKLNKLNELSNIDILIVPDRLLANWKEEYKRNIRICSLKEFKDLQFSSMKKIAILNLFDGVHPEELLELFRRSIHKYYIICYQEEVSLIEALENRNYNNRINEYMSQDRQSLSDVKYEIKPKEVLIPDIMSVIDGIYTKTSTSKDEDFVDDQSSLTEVFYGISFENEDILTIDGGTTVLRYSGGEGKWLKDKVYNLRPNDKVRIYNNQAKEKLYDIFAKEDSNGRYKEINDHSKIWKNALERFFKKQAQTNKDYDETIFLESLCARGASIKNEQTIKRWRDENDINKFPGSIKNFVALKEIVNDLELDRNFDSIKKSKKKYRGIMIALGRDLSEDTINYIISKGKDRGKMLEKFSDAEVKTFIANSAPEKRILKITLSDENEAYE